MHKTFVLFASTLLFCSVAVSAQWGSGWTIPAGAEKEVNPVKADARVLKEAKSSFDSKCAKCHGPEGKGDGKESDPTSPAADLSDSFRASLNPDGVIFHRIAGGKPPVMPAFKGEMSSEQMWGLVHYVKSLRKT